MNKTISIDLYSSDVMVHFGSRKELRKAIARIFNKDTTKAIAKEFVGDYLGRTVLLPNGSVILYMPKSPSTIEDYAVLQHEIFHVAFFVLERIGIALSEDSDEAYSYLIQFLTKRILEEFNLSFSSSVQSA